VIIWKGQWSLEGAGSSAAKLKHKEGYSVQLRERFAAGFDKLEMENDVYSNRNKTATEQGDDTAANEMG
jgi:hypothetical protein